MTGTAVRGPWKVPDIVEHCLSPLKRRRGVATHHEKTATVYLPGLRIAGRFPCAPGNGPGRLSP